MLPYRTESPVLPGRCPVRGGRVVHGPQFAYCPSPQGRCPQASSSSSSPGSALLLDRPWPRQCWALLCKDRAVTWVPSLPSSAPAARCPHLPLHRQRCALP